MGEELRRLEHLSLVSKICTELENHLGLNDKDVAEFIIDLADKNPTFAKFKAALVSRGIGEQFDDSFIHNLLRLIGHMKPKLADDNANIGDGGRPTTLNDFSKEELKKKIPALALPNDPTISMMDELENLLPKWKGDVEQQVVSESKSSANDRNQSDRRRPRRSSSASSNDTKRRRREAKEERHRRSSRSRSPRRSHNDDRKRSRRRSNSRDRDRGGDRRDRRGRGEATREKRQLLDDPVINDIYNGRVTSIQPFGCFVALDGFRKKAEGLVHISQLKKERVNNAADVVSRGQQVKVKVSEICYCLDFFL